MKGLNKNLKNYNINVKNVIKIFILKIKNVLKFLLQQKIV